MQGLADDAGIRRRRRQWHRRREHQRVAHRRHEHRRRPRQLHGLSDLSARPIRSRRRPRLRRLPAVHGAAGLEPLRRQQQFELLPPRRPARLRTRWSAISSCRGRRTGSSPPASFNSNAVRQHVARRSRATWRASSRHVTLNDYAEPYAEFGFMNDQTDVVIAPSGLFRSSNPLTADDPVPGQLQQSAAQRRSSVRSSARRRRLRQTSPIPGRRASASRSAGATSKAADASPTFEHTNYRGVRRRARRPRPGVELRRVRPVLLHDAATTRTTTI